MPEPDEDDLTPDGYLVRRSSGISLVRGLKLIRADTALLVALVNDAHYGEACQVLYAGNVFHLNTHEQLHGFTKGRQSALFITNFELVNFASASVFLKKDLVGLAIILPKLKRLVVAFNGLPHTTTLREHLNKIGVIARRELVCVAVGNYKLDFGEGKIIYFRHYGMVKSWRVMNRDCAEHQGLSAWNIVSVRTHVFSLSPHVWATAFDLLTWGKSKLALNNAYNGKQRRFLRQYKKHLTMRPSTRTVTLAMSRGRSFMNLDKHKSRTAEILEGMTDLLLANGVGWARLVQGNND
ncbi:hypothetical protein LTR56_004949 [Elasticomyces elasticus]|nr:hypothetical protein LTR22_015764 [Elasticomyces elasticus]KAK3652655.1 hypothetical protein LTR56_004949 [Elasticomyces elasticus]KAK4914585.1 hypothetical protein LTR49_017152 [Elasticomyces elasticus]KAK5753951.1 hypothetical protein LTS12_015917 [Elasticomyces elasticus]